MVVSFAGQLPELCARILHVHARLYGGVWRIDGLGVLGKQQAAP